LHWARKSSIDELDLIGQGTASEYCGIRYIGIGDEWLEATMPLDSRTLGANGALHPGALGIFAETIGSVAASLCIDTTRQICVGQILHINHPVLITSGPIRARASAVSILPDSHVWNVEIKNPIGATVCVARLTMAIIDRVDQ